MKLREYQERFVNNIAIELRNGKRKTIAQLATGGGKTICFSAICDRYIKKSGKSILILVHRKELLKQAVHSLNKANQIHAQPVIAGMRTIPVAPVYVAMIETAYKRLDQFQNIGMVIIDEAHLGNFTKVIDFFTEQFIIGFTATPLASKKDAPLKNFFDSIVCGVDIPELIESGNLCREVIYGAAEVVKRAELKMKMGDFDEKQMAIAFSNPKYIQSTVNAYKQHSEGRKTIIFNCNIEHSELVNQAFITAGYNSKHLDSDSANRDKILEWFDCTPDAILCNVGIATTGFDQPDIETVIINKATASMPLWLQMCGRGARPHPVKLLFTIIDLGGNTVSHGLWSQPKDWRDIFYNPPKKGNGVAPVKDCPQCAAMIHTRCSVCPECDYEFPKKEIEEEHIQEFMVLSKGLDIYELIEKNSKYKDYYTFFVISRMLANQAKNTIPKMNNETFDFILENNLQFARLWCKAQKKRWSDWHTEQVTISLIREIQKLFPTWKKEYLSAVTKA
jgi:superfamily II DNA or RNA helicase